VEVKCGIHGLEARFWWSDDALLHPVWGASTTAWMLFCVFAPSKVSRCACCPNRMREKQLSLTMCTASSTPRP